MSRKKEPAYFLGDRSACLRLDAKAPGQSPLERYLRLFPAIEQKRYAGESTTPYTHLPYFRGVAERIHRFNPGARLVYLVRDPVERTLSHYWYRAWRGLDHIALEDEELQMASRNLQRKLLAVALDHEEILPSPEVAICKNPFYCAVSYYAMQLREYLRFFPRAQIYIITHEDLILEPALSMQAIFEWLGLEIPPAHSNIRYSNRENSTPGVFEQRRSHLPWKLRNYGPLARLRYLVPRSLRRVIWHWIKISPLVSQQVNRSEVDLTEVIEYLRDLQIPQAKEFEELCEHKFPHWRTLWEGRSASLSPSTVLSAR
jgi:hypothetical protein